MNLVLIGYRGTGKTSVAQCLAARLGWSWIDTDAEVERRAGRSIAAIFADLGEPAFRDLESAALGEWITRPETIVATGGGIVLREEHRQLLSTNPHVVWLTASVDVIERRIAADATTAARRPNLLGGGTEEIRELLARRTPLYRQCATIEIATDEQSPDAIAADIIARLGLAARGQEAG